MTATDTVAQVAPETPVAPSMHLTFRGDHSGILGRVMGPNVAGEYWGAVTVEHDAAANRSRVGVTLIDSPETYRAVKALEAGPETPPPGVHHHVPPAVAFCAYCAANSEASR